MFTNKASRIYKNLDPFWIQKVKIRKIQDRLTFFLEICSDKRVIHFGCNDWPIFNPLTNLHIQLSKVAKIIHGFDIDKEGIKELKKYVDQLYFSDFSELDKTEYDICLVPETIEHVDNVQIFLKNLSEVNAKTFIITAPNCFSKHHINATAYDNDQFIEAVHPDHNCWYSPYTLKNQIEKYSSLIVKDVVLLSDDRMICCISEKA